MSDVARLRAARALAHGATNAAAAREVGVDRATIGRWRKEPSFQDLILKAGEEPETPQEQAAQGLSDLVPKALETLEKALDGADISPQQQTVALNIIKAAKTLEPSSAGDEGPSTLTSLIKELDERQAAG